MDPDDGLSVVEEDTDEAPHSTLEVHDSTLGAGSEFGMDPP